MNFDGTTCDNDEDICNLFSSFFESVYKCDDNSKCPNLDNIPSSNVEIKPSVIL